MKSNTAMLLAATNILGLYLMANASSIAEEAVGVWRESVALNWDAKTQNYFETPVKVWDAQSGTTRRFNWDGGVDAGGYATGKGKLEWREMDAPDYGTEGLISVYQGTMKEGKRSGQGKVRFANGERYEGSWNEDLPNGWGEVWFASGDYYQGDFVNGRMEGKGTFVTGGVEVYEGSFLGGKRNGTGETQLGEGVSYNSEWNNGIETPESVARREEALSRIGEDNAIQIGLVTALSRNESFERAGMKPLTYESYFQDGEFGFRPAGEFIENYEQGGLVDSFTPEIGSLFMEMALENRKSRQIIIERGEVEVLESVPDLAPYIIPWPGASEIAFDLANAGWGDATNCVFDFNLSRPGEGAAPGEDESYEFQIKLGDFKDRTLKVDMTDAFKKCGVDVDFAMAHRNDSMSFRGKWKRDQADPVFGRFAKYNEEGAIDSASVDLHGRLSYEWMNAEGEKQEHSVLYTGFIQLIYLVEGGDAMGGYAKYDIGLRYEGENYRLPFGFSERVAPFQDARFALNLNSERSSFHRFRVVLHCSDGTNLRSPICRVHFFRPRDLNAELYGIEASGGEAAVPEDSPYLFPDSDRRLLGNDELSGMTKDQLWQARNEIFVRHGYIFKGDRGKQFAASFGELYQPIRGADEVDALLNATEKANIEAILRYEN